MKNEILTGFKPFCASCPLVIMGKLPKRCYHCDDLTRLYQIVEANDERADRAIAEKGAILENYIKLFEEHRELKKKYDALLKGEKK